MHQIPENITQSIHAYVMRDLRPSWWVMWAKTFLALFIGGAASLLVCEQFGFGLSPLAGSVGEYLHCHFSQEGCAIICACIFVALPLLILRLSSSHLQFKVICRKGFFIAPVWLLLFGGGMSLHFGAMKVSYHDAVWVMASVLLYPLAAFLLVELESLPLFAFSHK